MSHLTYVLITPAKNEAKYIVSTIHSVLSQRQRPVRWVIVDDGSFDGTAETVAEYAERYEWIKLIVLRTSQIRNFASKVNAFNVGLQTLADVSYDLIGNLDADITLGGDYYANIVAEFETDSRLGLAGGVIYTPVGSDYRTTDTTWDSVGGAIQLFRKECFREIRGYLPIESGGIDAAAEIMARMRGWAVRKIAGNGVYEQRRTGYSHGRPWKASYKEGVQYQRLGYSTVFYCLRCAYRLADPPVVLGSVLGLVGFLFSKLRGDPVCLPAKVVSSLRAEQIAKIRRAIVTRGRVSPAH